MSAPEVAGSPREKTYWCFISYRHADNHEQDREWASWLHREIERYDIPAELVGEKLKDGTAISARIYPVFRDEDSLAADDDLAVSIAQALDDSRFLVVLCSPRAVESRYVAQEIRTFKANSGNAGRIIPAIIAGEPGDPGRECFPEPLRHAVRADGTLDSSIIADPLAADFRVKDDRFPYEGFTSAEAYRLRLKQEGKLSRREIKRRAEDYEYRLQRAKLKVIAGILDVTLDELLDRDKAHRLRQARKRARNLTIVSTIVVVLALVAVWLGIVADARRREVQVSLARAHRSEAVRLIEDGRSGRALAWLAASLRLNPRDTLTIARAVTLLSERTFAIPLPEGPPYMPKAPAPKVRGRVFDALSRDDSVAAADLPNRGTFGIFRVSGDSPDTTFIPYPFEDLFGSSWHLEFDAMGRWAAIMATSPTGTEAGIWEVAPPGGRSLPVIEPFQAAEPMGGGMKLDAGLQPSGDRTLGKLHLQPVDSGTWLSWDVADGRYHALWSVLPPSGATVLERRDSTWVATVVGRRGWRFQASGESRYVLVNRQGQNFPLEHGGRSTTYALDAVPGGDLVASGGRDKFARTWHLGGSTVRPGATMLHEDYVDVVRLSDDGTLLITATGSPSGTIVSTVRLWDARTGELLGGPWPTPGQSWACGFYRGNAEVRCVVRTEDAARPLQLAAWPIGGSRSPDEALALADLLEAVGGWKLTDERALESVPMAARLATIARVRGLAQAADASPLMTFASWFLADRASRGSPISTP